MVRFQISWDLFHNNGTHCIIIIIFFKVNGEDYICTGIPVWAFSLTQYDTTNKIIIVTRMMTTWFWKWHNTNYSWWSVKWFSAKLSITYDVCNPSAWKVKRNANLTWQYRTYIMQISRGSSFFKRQMNSLAVKNLNLLRQFQLWCVLGCATDLNFHQ